MKTLAEAKERIASLETQLAEVTASVEASNQAKQALESNNAELATQNNELLNQIGEMVNEIQAMKASNEELKASLESSKLEAVKAAVAIGVPPVEGESQVANKDEDSIKQEFASIKDPHAKNEFYLKNRDILNPFKR